VGIGEHVHTEAEFKKKEGGIMIWIILFLISVVFFLSCVSKGDNSNGVVGLFFSLIFGSINLVILIAGIRVYPDLKGRLMEIKTLQSKVNDIRSAYYKEAEISKNAIISGDIANFRQSTNLSEFLKTLAEKEARYNETLTRVKIEKEFFIYRFLGRGLFISKKIYELKPTI